MPAQNERNLKPLAEAESTFRRWLSHLNEEFTRHTSVDRRSEIVRDELFQLYLGRPHGGKLNTTLTSELASNTLYENFDPRNVTFEYEHDEAIDPKQYDPRKPLIFFWQMFDQSPLGLNYWLGVRFRYMLGHHIFKQIGKGVKLSRFVTFRYGYQVTLADNCTLGEGVFLDDRNELTLREGSQIEAHTKIDRSS